MSNQRTQSSKIGAKSVLANTHSQALEKEEFDKKPDKLEQHRSRELKLTKCRIRVETTFDL